MSSFRWVDHAEGAVDIAVVATPLGKFAITASSGILLECNWASKNTRLREPDSALLSDLLIQLHRYWENPAETNFSAPLLQQGSAFSRTVWDALCAIPCGETRSYGELAKQLRTAPRAIGAACRNNPFTLIIPCHRVVAAGGLGGYSGESDGALTDIKRHLLAHEGCAR